jgi:hypothetical protein
MSARNGGQSANRSGHTAEQLIASVLQSRGFVYTRQYPVGHGIYGKMIRADFYIPPVAGLPDGLAIESKWQDVAGSADEKFPYLVANIRYCYPCPTIIVIDGGGVRSGATHWLRTQVDGVHLMAVHTIAEFVSWANRHPRMAA